MMVAELNLGEMKEGVQVGYLVHSYWEGPSELWTTVVIVTMNCGQRLQKGYLVHADTALLVLSTRVQVGMMMMVEMKSGKLR